MNEPKKQSGILWKLTAEEKGVVMAVCDYAMIASEVIGPNSTERMRELINQLLGEEK